MNLEVLCNILEIPASMRKWYEFKKNVLQIAIKDINTKSNLVILDVIPKKTGKKVTDIEIMFDYKNNKTRISREKKKRENFVKAVIDVVQDQYIGKALKTKEYGLVICEIVVYDDKQDRIILTCTQQSNNQKINFIMNDFNSIKLLEKSRQKAESDFYLEHFLQSDVNKIFDEKAIKKLFGIE